MSEQPRRRRRQQMPSDEPVMPSNESMEPEAQKTEIIAPSVPRSFPNYEFKSDIHTKEGLLDYIKAAIELETDLATQEQLLTQCQADIQRRKPKLVLLPQPDAPRIRNSEGLGLTVGMYVFLACISFIAMIPLFVIGQVGFGLVFGFAGFFCVAYAMNTGSEIKEIKDENQRQRDQYEENMRFSTEQNKSKETEYYSAVCECDASLQAIREEIQPHIDETQSILSRLYSKGIIYPKYCNLPALTSIYEYYMTGRCEELTGPHGAYNLYEDELRKDTVISQLNTVIENLEQIRQNQYMLYEQVCSIRQNTAAIRSELAQIKGYTVQIAELSKLNAYYAARTEANTRILMYYHL